MTSPRQMLANQQNAQRSTGPKTDRGRAVSAANARKDGLTGQMLTAADQPDVADRLAQFRTGFRIHDDYGEFLLETAAKESVRLDRCRQKQAARELHLSLRMTANWDAQRQLAAVQQVDRLAAEPAVASLELVQTRQGCALLLARWQALGRVLQAQGTWSAGHRSLALDLLGVSADLRDLGLTELEAATDDELAARAEAVVTRELMRLGDRLQASDLIELEAVEQVMAEHALTVDVSPEGRLLARYEGGASRKLQWALSQLEKRAERHRQEVSAARQVAAETKLRQSREQRPRAAQPASAPLGPPPIPAVLPVSAVPSANPAPAAPPSGSPLSVTATLAGALKPSASPAAPVPVVAPRKPVTERAKQLARLEQRQEQAARERSRLVAASSA